jgi:hypothetical protein
MQVPLIAAASCGFLWSRSAWGILRNAMGSRRAHAACAAPEVIFYKDKYAAAVALSYCYFCYLLDNFIYKPVTVSSTFTAIMSKDLITHEGTDKPNAFLPNNS